MLDGFVFSVNVNTNGRNRSSRLSTQSREGYIDCFDVVALAWVARQPISCLEN
jgi:hypothetical protein